MAIRTNLEAMLAKGRDDAMLRFGLGSACFSESDFTEAVIHLEQCLKMNPDYSAAYKLLGKAYLKMDDDANARRIFEKGLPVAQSQGDKQTVKEMTVFLNKIRKRDDKSLEGKSTEEKTGGNNGKT